MNHTGRRVARSCDCKSIYCTDLIAVAVLEQSVELRPVTLKIGALIEHFSKRFLDFHDARADTNFTAQLVLQIGSARKMVGVNMRFDDPLKCKIV